MKIVDLNLLLYATNVDAPHHERARDWWNGALNSDETVGLPWIVILGFLRISTRPGAYSTPLAVDEALTLVGEWISHPLVVPLSPGPHHWAHLNALIRSCGTAGNLTTDAHLAALSIDYGGVLYSTDSDFARFAPSLRFVNPLAASKPDGERQ